VLSKSIRKKKKAHDSIHIHNKVVGWENLSEIHKGIVKVILVQKHYVHPA